MTTENKKILSYFGLAVGLGLVGAMVYYALSKKSLNIDKTNIKCYKMPQQNINII